MQTTCPQVAQARSPANRILYSFSRSRLPAQRLFSRFFSRPEIPRPMRAPDAELGVPLADPPRVIVHLPPAQTHHVPTRRGMKPVAVSHLRKRVPRGDATLTSE